MQKQLVFKFWQEFEGVGCQTSHLPPAAWLLAGKKKINWGDVPAIFQMVSSSLGDLDGLLTSGFDNPYKRILNKKQ